MMVWVLRLLFAGILGAMLWVTTAASLDRGVLPALADLWPDPWFRATLADAYFGFLSVYVWIAYRERGIGARLLWLVLVMGLGNIAIATYCLMQLFKLRPGQNLEDLLRPSTTKDGQDELPA